MAECEFDTVIHEALHDEARGRFLERVERVFEEAKQATSIKVNYALPIGQPASEPQHNGNGHGSGQGHFQPESPFRTADGNDGERPLITKKLPPYVEPDPDEYQEFLQIHKHPGPG
jgi:hypothetical protein